MLVYQHWNSWSTEFEQVNIFKNKLFQIFLLKYIPSFSFTYQNLFSKPCHHKGVQVISTTCKEQAANLWSLHFQYY